MCTNLYRKIYIYFSLVPVTRSRWCAQYEVVEFQPRAEDTRTLDSGLKVIAIYLFPIDDLVPPLSPPPRDSPVRDPCLSPLCPSVHPSLSSSCLLSVHFRLVFVVPPRNIIFPPPSAPLTGGRCQTSAPGVLTKFPDWLSACYPPPTCAAGSTWRRWWWGA